MFSLLPCSSHIALVLSMIIQNSSFFFRTFLKPVIDGFGHFKTSALPKKLSFKHRRVYRSLFYPNNDYNWSVVRLFCGSLRVGGKSLGKKATEPRISLFVHNLFTVWRKPIKRFVYQPDDERV